MLEQGTTAFLDIGGETYRVLGFALDESVNHFGQLRCTIDASLSQELPTAEELLDEPVVFSLANDESLDSRFFHGRIYRVAEGERDGAGTRELEIASDLARLKYRENNQTFLDKSIQDIAEAVLGQAGISLNVEWRGSAHTQVLNYCVQYQETDERFLRRVLAREGISWRLSHSQDEAALLFFDALNDADDESALELPFVASTGVETGGQRVYHISESSRAAPDRVSIGAFDPHRPSLRIESDVEAEDDGNHQNQLYFLLTQRPSPERAETSAQITLDSFQARRRVISATTAMHTLRVGQKVEIIDHPYSPLNGKFTIFAISHLEQQSQAFTDRASENDSKGTSFWAVPTEHHWAPEVPLQTPVAGLHTAITTGPSGEDIHTNEHGETTVRYFWDRRQATDQTSSRWMRTAQLPTGGSMLLPRVGWEVSVAYHEGDAEDPIVVSRLYNGTQMPPYKLPDYALRSSLQTATTPGDGSSNEIRMSDVKGEEQMFFNASRDMSVQVGNNTTQSVGNDWFVDVGVDHSLTVIDSLERNVGANQTVSISGNHDRSVTSLAVDDVSGDHSETIGGNLTQMIGGDHRHTIQGNSSVSVGGNWLAAVLGAVNLETSANFEQKIGAADVSVIKGSRSLAVAAAKNEQTGGAKMILCSGVRSVEAGALSTTVGGAMLVKADGNRAVSATAAFSEVAGGAEKCEAQNITIEAKIQVSIAMGGATVMITPASISISGANITVDGNLVQTSPMNLNN